VRDALGEERYLALRHQGASYLLADIVQFAAEGADDSRRTRTICHRPPGRRPAGRLRLGRPA
jgi:hypothetical protein